MLPMLAGAGIGAGVGALGYLFGGNKPQTTTTGMGTEDQSYLRHQREFAQTRAAQPMGALDPNFLAAMQHYMATSQAGQLGMQAQTDPNAANQFMNPFMAAMNPEFDRMRQGSINAVNQANTASGAFGGNRAGLAQGQAMKDVNASQAQFNYSGFNDAMSRAMQLASMGMGADSALAQGGQYMTERQRMYDQGSMGLLNQGFGQPMTTTSTTPNQRNLFQSLLGGAMTGASFSGGSQGNGYTPFLSTYRPQENWGAFGQSGLGYQNRPGG